MRAKCACFGGNSTKRCARQPKVTSVNESASVHVFREKSMWPARARRVKSTAISRNRANSCAAAAESATPVRGVEYTQPCKLLCDGSYSAKSTCFHDVERIMLLQHLANGSGHQDHYKQPQGCIRAGCSSSRHTAAMSRAIVYACESQAMSRHIGRGWGAHSQDV